MIEKHGKDAHGPRECLYYVMPTKSLLARMWTSNPDRIEQGWCILWRSHFCLCSAG
jgi:hypothetical protein